MFKNIFPDRQIAKMYSCAHTTTACILNGALAKELEGLLIDNIPFSLATNGSNDTGLQKMNPLTVRIDTNRGCVTTPFLDMCLTSASTAEAIFSKIDETIQNFDIDWNKCIAFGVDNTSVNMGAHNSIRTRVTQKTQLCTSWGAMSYGAQHCYQGHQTLSIHHWF